MRSLTARGLAIAAVLAPLALFAGGCGSASGDPQGQAAFAAYRSEMEADGAQMVRAIQALLAEVRAGDVPRAQSRYARARVRYGEVEPLASTFGALNSSIDTHAGNAPPSGFHEVEKGLWVGEGTKGMTAPTERLLANAKLLERRLGSARLTRALIAEGVANVLAELEASTLSGEEDRYSHIGLVDLAANVEGIDAAFEALKPQLAGEDESSKGIDATIAKLYATVGEYGIFARDPHQQRARSPGVSFVLFDELPAVEIAKIRGQVEELTRLFARLT